MNIPFDREIEGRYRKKYYGDYLGYVRELNDPLQINRIRAFVPGLFGKKDDTYHWTNWAPCVTNLIGSDLPAIRLRDKEKAKEAQEKLANYTKSYDSGGEQETAEQLAKMHEELGTVSQQSGFYKTGFFIQPRYNNLVLIKFLDGDPSQPIAKPWGFSFPVGGDLKQSAESPYLARGVADESCGKPKGELQATTHLGDALKEPESKMATKYGDNFMWKTPGGLIMEFDSTTDAERIHCWHKTKSYWEIDPHGSWSQHVNKDYFLAVDEKVEIAWKGYAKHVVSGDYTFTRNGQVFYFTKGDAQYLHEGEVETIIDKSFMQKIKESCHHLIDGDMLMKACKGSPHRVEFGMKGGAIELKNPAGSLNVDYPNGKVTLKNGDDAKIEIDKVGGTISTSLGDIVTSYLADQIKTIAPWWNYDANLQVGESGTGITLEKIGKFILGSSLEIIQNEINMKGGCFKVGDGQFTICYDQSGNAVELKFEDTASLKYYIGEKKVAITFGEILSIIYESSGPKIRATITVGGASIGLEAQGGQIAITFGEPPDAKITYSAGAFGFEIGDISLTDALETLQTGGYI